EAPPLARRARADVGPRLLRRAREAADPAHRPAAVPRPPRARAPRLRARAAVEPGARRDRTGAAGIARRLSRLLRPRALPPHGRARRTAPRAGRRVRARFARPRARCAHG